MSECVEAEVARFLIIFQRVRRFRKREHTSIFGVPCQNGAFSQYFLTQINQNVGKIK